MPPAELLHLAELALSGHANPQLPEEVLRAVVEDVAVGGYLRLYVYIPRADSYRFVILKLEE